MPDLKNIKTRLEQLPQLMAEIHLTEKFGLYTQTLEQSRIRLERVQNNIKFASMVNSNPKYRGTVFPELKSAAQIATKLHKEIIGNAESVNSRATENKITRLKEHAKNAEKKCQYIWEQEVEVSVLKWEKIAGVIQGLGAKGGEEMKLAIDLLKGHRIPTDDNEVEQLRSAIKNLHNSISTLKLEGSFGQFLEATVDGSASAKDLLVDEIREKMDEHDLWDSFQVRLR